MGELRDVYTIDGSSTGRVWEHGTPRTSGDYYHHAVIIIRTPDGLYTLAQRSLTDRFFPGRWDVTGGGVRHGETPLEGAIREAKEELGVDIIPADCRPLYRFRIDYEDGTGSHVFMFGTVTRTPEKYAFDPSEVNAVHEVPFDEFYENVMYNKDEGFGNALKAFEASINDDTPVRNVRPGDQDSLAYIQTESWKAAFRDILDVQVLARCTDISRAQAMYSRLLDARKGHGYILEAEGRPHMIAWWDATREADMPGYAELICIHSLPEIWRRGCGRKMMQCILDDMRFFGYKKVMLWVFTENTRARRFYEACGFSPNGTEREAFGATEMIYERSL